MPLLHYALHFLSRVHEAYVPTQLPQKRVVVWSERMHRGQNIIAIESTEAIVFIIHLLYYCTMTTATKAIRRTFEIWNGSFQVCVCQIAFSWYFHTYLMLSISFKNSFLHFGLIFALYFIDNIYVPLPTNNILNIFENYNLKCVFFIMNLKKSV